MMTSTSSSRHCRRRLDRRRRRHRTAVPTGTLQNARRAPRSGRRGSSSSALCVTSSVLWCPSLVLLLLVLLLPPVAEAMAKNNNGPETNSLGLLAHACASSFCGVGVTALDLWVSLEEKCDVESTPSLPTLWVDGGSGAVAVAADAGGDWSATSTALVCACVWSVLVYVGFRTGARVGSKSNGGYPVS